MASEKGADEVFCRSCGEAIKKRAAICPECGVKNEYDADDSRQTQRRSRQSGQGQSTARGGTNTASSTTGGAPAGQTAPPAGPGHDPTRYTTTVNDNWYYGVGLAAILMGFGMALPDSLDSVSGFAFLASVVLMPVSIYYDRQWLRATTEWSPDTTPWVIGSIVPVVNMFVGALYLYRRSNAMQVAPASAAVEKSATADNDDALETLRSRYSRGEIGEEEFNKRLDAIVGTEDKEMAGVYARQEAAEETDTSEPTE